MRLNLGCGGKITPGWLNVDKFPTCNPDQVVDLERFPWPWPDDSVDEVRMHHVLEHLGAQTEIYLGIIKELYRVCRDNAAIHIIVPHPRHDDFLNDPTHVRPVTPASFVLFSQAKNREWLAKGVSNSPLGLYLDVDFVVDTESYLLEEPWGHLYEQKKLPFADLQHAIRLYGNVIKQFEFVVRPIKPAGSRVAAPPAAVQAADAPLVPGEAPVNMVPSALRSEDA